MDIEASQRYQTHWTHSSESLFTVRVRPDGEFEFEGLNPAHERRTGLSTRELAGKTPHECLPAEVADAIVDRYRACVQSRRTTRYLETLDLPGGFRHWETTLVPVREPGGRIALLLGSARDVTEREHLQLAVSRSEARFQLLAETVPDIVFILHENGRLEHLSARFYEFTGARPRSRPSIASHLHPADRDLVRRWRRQGASRALFDTEVRLKGRDGQYRWFLIRASRLELAPGGQWFGVATDIHAVKEAAHIQQALNDRLNSILSSISDSFYTIDRDWRITSVNPQAATWFGRDPDRMIGMDLRQQLPVNRPVEAAIKRAMESGTRAHLETPSPIRLGRVVDVHVYPSSGGVSVFFRDITEAHTTRKNLKSSQDLLQLTVDSLSAHVAILNAQGVVIEANRAWRAYVATNGLPLHCEVGVNCLHACGTSDAEEKRTAASNLRDVLEGRSDGFTHLHRSDSGPTRWFHMLARGFEHEGERRAVVAFEDVTSLTLAQQALVESAERHLVLQEEDRRRIAADLHDSTGQHLVALSLTAARLEAMLPQTRAAAELFDDLRSSLDAAHREVRVYSYLLHPPYLAADGLVLSVRKFLRGFARRSGLRIIEHIDDGADHADMSSRRAVFRIVQEALSNVQRHSGATQVTVELRATDRLRLRIEDDGKGMPTEGPDGPAIGVGISGMHDRVRELGGRITFDQRGAGLVIEAELAFAPDLQSAPQG